MAHRPKEVKVTNDNGLADGHPEPAPESLQTLAEYLERSLDKATSIVMMRHTAGAFRMLRKAAASNSPFVATASCATYRLVSCRSREANSRQSYSEAD